MDDLRTLKRAPNHRKRLDAVLPRGDFGVYAGIPARRIIQSREINVYVVLAGRPCTSAQQQAEAPVGYYELMTSCWHAHALARPAMNEVEVVLRDMLADDDARAGGDGSACAWG